MPDTKEAPAEEKKPVTQENSAGEKPSKPTEAPAEKPEAETKPSEPVKLTEAEVKQGIETMFAVAEPWKPQEQIKFQIQFVSGQRALVRYLNTLDLVEYGLIEELDFFTRKLFPANIDASGNPEEELDKANENIWSALHDPKKRKRFLDMTGKLMAASSLMPKIIHDGVALVTVKDEDTGEERETTKFGYRMTVEEQITHFKKPITPLPNNHATYSGCIDFSDRMAFFQELNRPMSVIEPFREESLAMLQDLARSEGDGSPAE